MGYKVLCTEGKKKIRENKMTRKIVEEYDF